MIKFSHVYKTYKGPVHALRDLSFEVKEGEFVFLVGHSGAGKTTLFNILAAYDKPTVGKINVNNFTLENLEKNELPFYRRKIGVIFQDFKLISDWTIYKNLALPLEIQGEEALSIEEQVIKFSKKLGLDKLLEKYPSQLSGGEQQRVAVARCLLACPELIIADEPTGNLDEKYAKKIMSLLLDANKQGTTIIMATHDKHLVSSNPCRVLEIDSGSLLRDSKNE